MKTKNYAGATVEELLTAWKENSKARAECIKRAEQLEREWHKLTLEQRAEQVKAVKEGEAARELLPVEQARAERKKADELAKLGVILRNNYRVRKAEQLLPVVIGILEKYEGKPYGEKTIEKIRSEMYEQAHAYLYLNGRSISIYEADEQGYTNGMERFEISCFNQVDDRILTVENKIHCPDGWSLLSIGEFVLNPKYLLERLAKLKKRAEKLANEVRECVNEYTTLAPDGFEELRFDRLGY